MVQRQRGHVRQLRSGYRTVVRGRGHAAVAQVHRPLGGNGRLLSRVDVPRRHPLSGVRQHDPPVPARPRSHPGPGRGHEEPSPVERLLGRPEGQGGEHPHPHLRHGQLHALPASARRHTLLPERALAPEVDAPAPRLRVARFQQSQVHGRPEAVLRPLPQEHPQRLGDDPASAHGCHRRVRVRLPGRPSRGGVLPARADPVHQVLPQR